MGQIANYEKIKRLITIMKCLGEKKHNFQKFLIGTQIYFET